MITHLSEENAKNVTTDVINAYSLGDLKSIEFIPTRGDAISYIFQIRFFQVKV